MSVSLLVFSILDVDFVGKPNFFMQPVPFALISLPPYSLCPICSTCGTTGRWECEQNACLIEPDVIHAVNRGNYGYGSKRRHSQTVLDIVMKSSDFFLSSCAFRWKAANYSQLYGMTLDEGIRYRLGTQRPSRTIMNMNEIQVQQSPGSKVINGAERGICRGDAL